MRRVALQPPTTKINNTAFLPAAQATPASPPAGCFPAPVALGSIPITTRQDRRVDDACATVLVQIPFKQRAAGRRTEDNVGGASVARGQSGSHQTLPVCAQ
ncbi:unnamed protein product [Tilletia controversa]|nr:unnamed protein product [Tilletia controversa]